MRQKKTKKKAILIIAVIAVVILFFVFQSSNKKPSSAFPDSDDQMSTFPTYSSTDDARQTPTPEPTSSQVNVAEPDAGIDEAEGKLSQALRSSNASQLQALLTNDVVLGSDSGGQIDEASGKAAVANWLDSHWSSNLQYVSKHYVQHFGYWELTTTGWSNVQSGTVNFRFFRYDANGQRQAFEGEWLTYAVLY